MRRNCNLNLHLLPANVSSPSTSVFRNQLGSGSDQKQIKIFYSDATELQDECKLIATGEYYAGVLLSSPQHAIAILWLARREMEEKSNNINIHESSPSLQFQVHGSKGLSLKKSLQKFLQRRKDRIQTSMPY